MPVDLIIEGAVAKVVLNRPERLNALTWEMRQQLREHFSELRFNEAVRAIIVTDEGRAFCTGADVGGMERKDLRGEREKLQQGSHSYIRVLTSIEKPVIAAVRGPTVGIGWSIAMACDLIVASETARFSQIFRRIDGKVVDDPGFYRSRLDELYGIFGEDRVLYGSDWPNSDQWAPYPKVLGLVREYFSGKSVAAREKYFWKNSAAAYRWVKRESGQPQPGDRV